MSLRSMLVRSLVNFRWECGSKTLSRATDEVTEDERFELNNPMFLSTVPLSMRLMLVKLMLTSSRTLSLRKKIST